MGSGSVIAESRALLVVVSGRGPAAAARVLTDNNAPQTAIVS
jgi:hypothetical protein